MCHLFSIDLHKAFHKGYKLILTVGHVRHFLLADIWLHLVNKKAMVFAGGRIKKRMYFTLEGNYFSDRFNLGHPAFGLRLEIFCNCFFFLSTGLLTSLAIKYAGFSVEG